MRLMSACSLVLVGTIISGCAQTGGMADSRMSASEKTSCSVIGPKAMQGALIGAAGGAAAGAAINSNNRGAGALIGGLAGLIGGVLVGNHLDAADCEQAVAALQRMDTAKTGQAIEWANPSSGHKGTFVPLADASQMNGKLCRPYKRSMTMQNGPQTDSEQGIVCRDENGDWNAIS